MGLLQVIQINQTKIKSKAQSWKNITFEEKYQALNKMQALIAQFGLNYT